MISITVGVPTVNGPHRLERCLSHLFKDKIIDGLDIEIIVLDDGSDPEFLEQNRKLCAMYDIKFIEQGVRGGVPRAWNTICKAATKKIILLINDDIEVNGPWPDVIHFTLKNNPWLGAVGINAIEGIRPENFPVFPTYVESKILVGSRGSEIISPRGYAFTFRQKDYESIGGFDERYFCFFEEVDFALTMFIKKSLRSCILTYPLFHHYHAETTTTVLLDPTQIFNESKALFEKKWDVKWNNLRDLFNRYELKNESPTEWNSNLRIWV